MLSLINQSRTETAGFIDVAENNDLLNYETMTSGETVDKFAMEIVIKK